ncbi:hypothetical protein [Bacillus sp. USDA818B3_A]|uniref:hypothetical protein n=1 Tax=Bacillus sp. USDA818B3_A TaxID=2698834 RepID=UPI00136D8CF6|nr:hypothetical protein [Bacillus sp. USDA818B3_A]
MVTAILIPIICLYFYWLTKKEMKEQDKKWLEVGRVRQESIVYGEIKSISEEQQRFYYNRRILVQTLTLQTDIKVIHAVKKTPLTANVKTDTFLVGTAIKLYGSWEGSSFIFEHFTH